jgi:hypothetical protein
MKTWKWNEAQNKIHFLLKKNNKLITFLIISSYLNELSLSFSLLESSTITNILIQVPP